LHHFKESNKRGKETTLLHPDKNSANKVKTIWDIIKNNTGKSQISERISELRSDNGNIKDTKEIAHTFNTFFFVNNRELKYGSS
jgi:hypothetical protein